MTTLRNLVRPQPMDGLHRQRTPFRRLSSALLLTLVSLLVSPCAILAQESQEPSVSAVFERARELAFSGDREAAKDLARKILHRRPDHADAGVLLGRLHAWDDEFQEARRQLRRVLDSRPDYTDARRALVDVEIWSDDFREAVEQADRGLRYEPGDPGLVLKKANALRSLGEFERAESVVLRFLESHPGHTEAQATLERIRSDEEERSVEEQSVSTSQLYDRAQDLAFSGERDAAKQLARQLLELNPDHADARTLLGRLHAWDDEFEQARQQLSSVLEERPDYTDARRALVDVENWTDNYTEAVAQANAGLEHSPDDATLLLKKADALRSLERYDEAEAIVQEVLAREPENEQALAVLDRIRDRPARNRVKVEYEFQRFNTFSDDWHETSIDVTRRGALGSVTLRANLARRFSDDAAQFAVDAYPSLIPGVYAYLNLGVSPTRFYPELRYGAEVHVGLPWSTEISGGFRQLNFESSDVRVWTGSLSKYLGSYMITGRTYVTPKEGDNRSVSGQFIARYYMGDRFNYVGLRIGVGSSPDIDEVTAIQLQRLDSRSISIEGEIPVGRHLLLTFDAGYEVEELPRDRRRYRSNLGAGFGFRF